MKLPKVFLWRAATSLLLVLSLATTVHASPASHDLGQAFPHAINQSLSPLWRVYVFEREGVRYVQINDAFGRVHAAFATARGNFLVLPEGDDADRVVVPKASANQQAMCQGDGCGVGLQISKDVATASPSANQKAMCQGDGCNGGIQISDGVATASPSVNQEAMCQGCNNGIQTSAGVDATQLGDVIYQDATLQIHQTENAQHQPVWWVTPLQPTLTQP